MKNCKCLMLVTCCGAMMVASAAEVVTSPWATGGDVTSIDEGNFLRTYIHTFTNADAVATFASTGKRELSVRYLVVGAGGAGGARYAGSSYGGGGGGGGGVCEREGITFPVGTAWTVCVGAGATGYAVSAGASSISNGLTAVEVVPGGGNGASNASAATDGAAGGGASRKNQIAVAGTYCSRTLLETPEVGCFAGGDVGSVRSGGSGGGAGAAATKATSAATPSTAGEGLPSDITGETLVYGSGGGGGCGVNKSTNPYAYSQGAVGATRAGNGGRLDDDNNVIPATAPVANSGCGGGGAAGVDASGATGGADGIVIIRYTVAESPCSGGDIITRVQKREGKYTYLHVFTNPAAVATFANVSGRDIGRLRHLVVGAGGAGGKSIWANTQNSASGGGGGGVCETGGVTFGAGAVWQIKVGRGASASEQTAAEASSISNGLVSISTVPGGGNGGYRTGKDTYIDPTAGAAGGGGSPYSGSGTAGAAGTYVSSILGVSVAGGPFAGGTANKRQGGGGGGAGGAGGDWGTVSSDTVLAGKPFGGAGVVSDITGESLTYGAGGGGGECRFISGDTTYRYQGGDGGDRAGNGAKFVKTDDGITFLAATEPAQNSGGGGGGRGYCDGSSNASTDGADGIVVIRYDWTEQPTGMIIFFR